MGTGEAALAQAVSFHLFPLLTRLLNERVQLIPRSSAHGSRQRSLIIDDSSIGDVEVNDDASVSSSDEDVNSDEGMDEREYQIVRSWLRRVIVGTKVDAWMMPLRHRHCQGRKVEA